MMIWFDRWDWICTCECHQQDDCCKNCTDVDARICGWDQHDTEIQDLLEMEPCQ